MKKDDTYRSQFRLPYALYLDLKAAADRNKRNLNSELVFRLERALEEERLDAYLASKDMTRAEFDEDGRAVEMTWPARNQPAEPAEKCARATLFDEIKNLSDKQAAALLNFLLNF